MSWSRAQSKIENPEKTRSNWSRAVQSPDANVEQDHAVRIILILKIMIPLNYYHDISQASLEEGLEGQLGGADFLTALPPDGWEKEKVVEEVAI